MDEKNKYLAKKKQKPADLSVEEVDGEGSSISSAAFRNAMDGFDDDIMSGGEDEVYRENKQRIRQEKIKKKTIKKEEKQ